MNYSKKIYNIFNSNKNKELIGRLDTEFKSYSIDNTFVITTNTDYIHENSYVASPYSLIIDYGKEELTKIDSKIKRFLLKIMIYFFKSVFKYTEIDKMQTINNYLLSTNFFSKEWENLDIDKLEKEAIKRYPEHGLLIRSVNKVQNNILFNNLHKKGWISIVFRQVFLFEDRERWEKSHNAKIDKKLLNSSRFKFLKVDKNEKDFDLYLQSEKMYNSLYIDKYSQYNIQFKAEYLKLLVQEELLNLYLLKDTTNMKYVGVVGITQEDNIITVPIVGYDINYPQKDALYRRLIAFSISYAMERNALLNLSSGAPEFKRLRGASSHFEYVFVQVKHLSFKRKLGWYFIALISKYIYVPILRRL